MSNYMGHPLRRLHQLNGPSGLNPLFAVAQQYNFKFEDVPQTLTALGRKHVNYMAAVRLTFTGGAITSTAGTTIPRKVLTPMLISSVQIQGTEIGTPVSSSHMLGGIIDTDSYIRNGNRNNLFNKPGLTLAAATPVPLVYSVDIMLGHFGQKKGIQTCPLALFMRPGEIIINTPTSLAGVHSSLADVTISGCRVNAQAVLIPTTEIVIANPWQLTRHKANAGSGTDSVMLNSFGASSTLTGVQSKCGVGAILWAGNGLVGPVAGCGAVVDLTQFGADFLGLRQNNAPRDIVQQLFSELTDGKVIDTNLTDYNNALYPFFDGLAPATGNLNIAAAAEFFPVMFPVNDFEASKLLDAVGNPSYDLTGTFTPGGSHYSYVEGCYPFTMDKLNDLVAVIQRSHLGLEMFGTDDITLSTKLADGQDLVEVAVSNPEKLTYLPRVVVKKSNPAVK
jgi:hypothetical protein